MLWALRGDSEHRGNGAGAQSFALISSHRGHIPIPRLGLPSCYNLKLLAFFVVAKNISQNFLMPLFYFKPIKTVPKPSRQSRKDCGYLCAVFPR